MKKQFSFAGIAIWTAGTVFSLVAVKAGFIDRDWGAVGVIIFFYLGVYFAQNH